MNKINVRGGKMFMNLTIEIDPLWSVKDIGRLQALDARWASMAVEETERRSLLPCAVWSIKFPGTRYSSDIMKRLAELTC